MKSLDLWSAPLSMLSLAWRQRTVLASITRFELQKRFSGSVLGLAWIVLYPSLLLALYLFVFLVVFRVRFPGFSSFDYVLYVFAGLVPFIGLSEAVSSGCASMRQSLYLVKNVVLPPELIPLRTVLASLARTAREPRHPARDGRGLGPDQRGGAVAAARWCCSSCCFTRAWCASSPWPAC